MLRSALATFAVFAAAIPAAIAQEDVPLTPAQAKSELDAAVGKWTGGSADLLEEWIARVRHALAERSAPELRAWLREEAVPAIRPAAITRKKLKSSRVKRELVLLYLSLEHEPATEDVLDLIDRWQGSARRAEVDGDLVSLMLPLADTAAVGAMTDDHRDRFFKQMEWMAKYAGASLPDALPAFERAGERRYVELLTKIAMPRALKSRDDAPIVLQRIAESLGRWWDHSPQLDLRVPALFKLRSTGVREIATAADAGVKRLLFGWSNGSARKTERAVRALAKSHGNDGSVLAELARRRLAGTPEPEHLPLATELSGRLDALKRRDTQWATPLFLEVLSWTTPELGQARAAAMTGLRFSRDHNALDALLAMLKDVDNPQIRSELIETIGALSNREGADPSAAVKEVLLRSLRTGAPLDQKSAARELGLNRITEAVDPLFDWGDRHGYTERRIAWQAVARIAGARAVSGLRDRFDESDAADRLPIIEALTDWHELPLPDSLADRVGIAWDTETNAALRGAALQAATVRGLAHPGLRPRVQALITDAASPEPLVSEALKSITSTFEFADARPLLLAVLTADIGDARMSEALSWLHAHPGADLRPPCLTIAQDSGRPANLRFSALRLLADDGVWDDAACGPVLVSMLAAATADHALGTEVRNSLIRHPMAAHVPALIALLPRTDPDSRDDRATHRLTVREVLRRWAERSQPEELRPPITMPALRKPWTKWWKSAQKAGVKFR